MVATFPVNVVGSAGEETTEFTARKDWTPWAQEPDQYGIIAHTPDPSKYHAAGNGYMIPHHRKSLKGLAKNQMTTRVVIDPVADAHSGESVGGLVVDLAAADEQSLLRASELAEGDPYTSWANLAKNVETAVNRPLSPPVLQSSQIKAAGDVPAAPGYTPAPPPAVATLSPVQSPVSAPQQHAPQPPSTQPDAGGGLKNGSRYTVGGVEFVFQDGVLRPAPQPPPPPTQPQSATGYDSARLDRLEGAVASLVDLLTRQASQSSPPVPVIPPEPPTPHSPNQPTETAKETTILDELGLSWIGFDQPNRPTVAVVFYQAGGQHRAMYHHVARHKNCLALLYDNRYDGDFFIPGPTDEKGIRIEIPSLKISTWVHVFDFHTTFGCIDSINLFEASAERATEPPVSTGLDVTLEQLAERAAV